MKCPKCKFENREGAKFCLKCGNKLEFRCPQCDSALPIEAVFCDECGQDLQTPPDSPVVDNTESQLKKAKLQVEEKDRACVPIEGERKHITALFSDMSGYTEMLEKLDPEEVKEITSRIFSEVAKIVAKYEGFIEKFIGDAVMALFGVPKSHEDDPVRAIKAAREIHAAVNAISHKLEKKIGQPLEMHTGINTGLVVTGDIDLEKGTHGAVGDTINLASRLSDLAKPGEIIVSLKTRELSTAYFKIKKLGQAAIKGKVQPITTYRVEDEIGLKSRFDVSEKHGLTVYSGREQELNLLQSCLEKAVVGKGQFVTVVGEAGMGKSRLLYEFQNSIDRDKVKVWRGYCQSFWSATNYFPFIKILRHGLHLREKNKPEDLHEFVVSSTCAISQKLEKYLPFYLQILSIPSKDYQLPEHLEGQELKNAFQDAMAAISILKSEQQPMVLILEDWHWVDEASDSALKHLVSVIGSHHLLVVTIYRPIYSSNWGNWSYYTPIVLKPIDSVQGKNIIKSVFNVEHLPTGLADLIIARSGGNPLFIEEICRSLIEDGLVEVNEAKQAILTQALGSLTIPDKIQAIISARFDLLDHDAKETLRIASVIGRRFGQQILKTIYKGRVSISQVLEKLKTLEMIQQTRVLPEAEYWFRHALTKEVVYENLLLKRRKVLHGLIGQALEELYPDQHEEQVNLLQYHFRMAENWSKAIYYGYQSAEKAQRLSQFQEAVTMYEQVLRWLLRLPEDRPRLKTQIDILLQQERLYETLGRRDKQQKIIDKLISLVQLDKDPALLAEIYLRQGDLFVQVGYYNEAEGAINNALTNWRSLSDAMGESRSLRSMGFLRWHQGLYKEAIRCNEEALDIDRQRDDPMAIATDLTNLGAVWRNLGDLKRSLKCLEQALKIYESTQKPVKQAFTLYSIANVHREQDILDRAIKKYQQAQEIFEQHHDRVMSSRAIAGIASIYKKQGKVQESLHLYEDVVKTTREIKYRQGLSHALHTLGDLLLTLNKPRKALNYLLESMEIFVELKDRQREAEIWEKIGNIYEQNIEDYQNALNAWDKARELQAMVNDRCSELEILEKMGQLTRQHLGASKQALRYFRKALDIATKIGDRKKQGKLLNDIGIIEWHLKAYGDALKHYEKALEIYYELKETAHAGLMLNSIGITLHKLGHHAEALGRLREAVDINHQAGEQLLKGHGLAAMGDIYCEIGENEQALNHYQASLEIRNKIGDHRGQGWMLHSLARVYLNQNLDDKARDCLTQAQMIAKEYSDKELAHACTRLCKQLSRPA